MVHEHENAPETEAYESDEAAADKRPLQVWLSASRRLAGDVRLLS